jgi:hypothetical protein
VSPQCNNIDTKFLVSGAVGSKVESPRTHETWSHKRTFFLKEGE